MPFARVGAMPQAAAAPATQNGGSGGGRARSNRQKGITMEDLKKQTAIRLAQEQQHSQVVSGNPKSAAVATDPRTRHPVVTPQTLAARRIASAHSGSVANNSGREAAAAHYHRHHHNHNQNPVVHHIPNTVEPGLAVAYSTPQYYDQQQQLAKNSRNRNTRQGKAPGASQQPGPSAAARASKFQAEQQRTQYLRSASAPALPMNAPVAGTTGYNTASSTQGGQSSSTSKLPHGLTVHELKEMTKARLQAEAAEKMSMSSGSDRPPSTTAMEMEVRDNNGFESVQPSFSQQPMHPPPLQDFDRSTNASLVSAQMQTQLAMTYDQGSNLGQPAQVSPLPPAFQNLGPPTSSFNETSSGSDQRIVGNRNRVDSFPENWETASVTSHNSTVASDYLGSDSAFSSGVGGFSQVGDDPTGVPLGRTQSYPMGSGRPAGTEMPSRETTPTSIPSPLGSSYFDGSGSLAPQNSRQRALTLSPRPGLSLLHEDRPGFSDEDLGIPNFSSSNYARQQLTARSRRSFSPVLQQQPLASEPIGSFATTTNFPPGLIGGSVPENRARTSSVVSLPAFSNTAEEFALDAAGSRRSSDTVSVRDGPMRDYPAPSMTAAESFLASAGMYNGGEGRSGSSSSVFRNDLGGIEPPPGLGPPRAQSMDNIGGNRVRAATWVAGQVSGSDVFGSGSGLYEYPGEDTLAGDLASILKLSGAEEKPDIPRPPGMFNGTGFL